MLSVGELSRITKELILGLEPSNRSQEALAMREKTIVELARMEREGLMPDLPDDFDDLPALPPPPPAPSKAERLESKKRLIRHNLEASWASQEWLVKEHDDEAQCYGAFLNRIEAEPLMSEPDRRQLLAEVVDCVLSGELATWSAERVRQRLDRAVRRSLAPKKKRKRKRKR